MKKLGALLASVLLLVLAATPAAWSHPGRTDAQGCHTDKKTGEYHCHSKGKGKPSVKVKVPTQTQVHTQTKTVITGPITVSTSYPATVLRVSDGDTMVVRTRGFEDIRVRLYGIDAPESKQPGGPEATAFLRPLQGQTVFVTEVDTDRYSRSVALIEHRGQSVNVNLVAQGHAWYYPQYCKRQPVCGQIQAAEKEARAARRGLWQADNPVPPWDWRRK